MTPTPDMPSGIAPPPLPSKQSHTPPPLPIDALDSPAFFAEDETPYAVAQPKKTNYIPLIIIVCILALVGCIAYAIHQGSAMFKGFYSLGQVVETQTTFQRLAFDFDIITDETRTPTVGALLKEHHGHTRKKTILDGWNKPIKITILPDGDGNHILMLRSSGIDKVMNTRDDLKMKCDHDGDTLSENFEEVIKDHSDSMFNTL